LARILEDEDVGFVVAAVFFWNAGLSVAAFPPKKVFLPRNFLALSWGFDEQGRGRSRSPCAFLLALHKVMIQGRAYTYSFTRRLRIPER
jgi:hypothetical protein